MIIKRLAMAGNGMQEKINLVSKKFFQKPKTMLHDFFAKPEQANERKKENESVFLEWRPGYHIFKR